MYKKENKGLKICNKIGILIYTIIIVGVAFMLTQTSPALRYTKELSNYEITNITYESKEDNINELETYIFDIKYEIDGKLYTGNIELTDNKYLDDIIKYKQDETFENAKEVLGVLYYNEKNPEKLIKKWIPINKWNNQR